MKTHVTWQLPGGGERSFDVEPGTSLMQAALSAGVPGIVAECGGQLMCATCHVYLDQATGPLPERSDDERDMLELAASPVTDASRLSCQLVVSSGTEAVRVTIPEKQT
jgi:2Fe-2S ferredoxin